MIRLFVLWMFLFVRRELYLSSQIERPTYSGHTVGLYRYADELLLQRRARYPVFRTQKVPANPQ